MASLTGVCPQAYLRNGTNYYVRRSVKQDYPVQDLFFQNIVINSISEKGEKCHVCADPVTYDSVACGV